MKHFFPRTGVLTVLTAALLIQANPLQGATPQELKKSAQALAKRGSHSEAAEKYIQAAALETMKWRKADALEYAYEQYIKAGKKEKAAQLAAANRDMSTVFSLIAFCNWFKNKEFQKIYDTAKKDLDTKSLGSFEAGYLCGALFLGANGSPDKIAEAVKYTQKNKWGSIARNTYSATRVSSRLWTRNDEIFWEESVWPLVAKAPFTRHDIKKLIQEESFQKQADGALKIKNAAERKQTLQNLVPLARKFGKGHVESIAMKFEYLKEYKEAEKLYRELNIDSKVIHVIYMDGRETEAFAQAEKYIASSQKNKTYLYDTAAGLAIHEKVRQYEKAIIYATKAYEGLKEKSGNPGSLKNLTRNYNRRLWVAYSNLKQYDKAFAALDLYIANSSKWSFQIYSAPYMKAEILIKHKKFREAEKYVKEMEEIMKKHGRRDNILPRIQSLRRAMQKQ